jgi:2'-5' RNA ligase
VALLVPAPFSHEIDGLRRALGSDALTRIPPHLTLVPPVNVRTSSMGAALRVLRDAAAGAAPLRLRLGPPASFLPDTPTVHLAVLGPVHAVSALRALRDAVFVTPLARELTHPFVPHVTLDDDADPSRIEAICGSLGAYAVDVTFERLYLLVEERRHDGVRRWVPLADVPLGPRVVVGRGGVELELTASVTVDPEGFALFAASGRTPPGSSAGATVVSARRHGELVGVATYVAGDVEPIVLVAKEHRGQGVGDQLRRAIFDAAGG